MYITALIIGLGVYMLYRDLPQAGKAFANKYTWLSHAAVFFGLFAMHGGSAEGTVLAGIATVFFRWMQHMHIKRETKNTLRIVSEQSRATGPDADSDTYMGTLFTDILTCACAAYIILMLLK